MKNVQPQMNTMRQTRKAVLQINAYLAAGNTDKACYTMHVFHQMLDSIDAGAPRPWSEFQPMIAEEFGD